MNRKGLVGLLIGGGAIAALAFAVPANASPVADSHAAPHAVTNAKNANAGTPRVDVENAEYYDALYSLWDAF